MLKVDLVLTCRAIHTMSPRQPIAQAIAVAQGRIIAVGTRRQVMALRHGKTRIIDMPDAVAIPAFADCHTHLFHWACRLNQLDLGDVHSLDRVGRLLADRARRSVQGDWLIARRLNWSLLTQADDREPRDLLDGVTGDRPTVVLARDGHSAWLNSAGLRAAVITAKTKTPPGGCIPRDGRGQPVGIVQENALALLPDLAATMSDQQVRAGLAQAIRQSHQYGVATIHSMEHRQAFDWFGRFRDEGKLPLRVCWAPPAALIDHAAAVGLQTGFGDDWLWIGGVKLFADGTLGSQTAWMRHAYPGRKGYRGVATCGPDELRDTVCRAARAGLGCCIHAIGDRANHYAIAAIAAARRVESIPLVHRIEHAQCIQLTDITRMATLGIIASMQPCHLPGDIALADRYWPRARQWAHPWRSLQRAGVTLAFGSDVPVESNDPLVGLDAAVNRQAPDGQPASGWFPAERLTVRQALRAYTVGAAIAGGRSDCMGQLQPGYVGDVALLSDDPLRSPRSRLKDLRVIGTIIGGRVVHGC